MNSYFETTCCITGGGPAGMMLGYLLARQNARVTVLEKHGDFFRDFRGDTVHPSTLELMHELGIIDEFLRLPHQELTSVGGIFGDFPFEAANFSRVPTRSKFVALMPQWDFLDFLARKARQLPRFDLRMRHEAVDLIQEGQHVVGVAVRTPAGRTEIRADLVVGCDGRHSTIRQAARLPLQQFGVPIDVLWFRISRKPDDPDELFGNINYGRVLVLINRGDYFQAGLIIPKGGFEAVQRAGMDALRETILKVAPYLGTRVEELQNWEQIKLLTVQINRLREWYRPGLLCIGDAAHAMSPAGGVGINLAIQDAVAAANLLATPLREGRVTEGLLKKVQQRREFPTKVTQFLQLAAHKQFDRIFSNPGPVEAPWGLRLVMRIPGRQHLMGRLVGVGVRPEHIAKVPSECLSATERIAVLIGSTAGRVVRAISTGKRWATAFG